MSLEFGRIKAAFLDAVHNIPHGQWDGYLDEVCNGDPTLRRELQGLLAAHLAEGTLPARAIAATVDEPQSELVGTQVGPYKLRERIGEGGMGVVYVAEQERPIRRKVALKVVKPGMDTRQVIARFEAERQALALMDHPNIARVLDAGTTGDAYEHPVCRERPPWRSAGEPAAPSDEPAAQARADDQALARDSRSGRPDFVMELVRGIPITDYCDQAGAGLRERLELFVTACQAVQHAH